MPGGPSGHRQTGAPTEQLGHLPSEAMHTAPHVLEAVPEQSGSHDVLDEEDRGSAGWDYDVTEDSEAADGEAAADTAAPAES